MDEEREIVVDELEADEVDEQPELGDANTGGGRCEATTM